MEGLGALRNLSKTTAPPRENGGAGREVSKKEKIKKNPENQVEKERKDNCSCNLLGLSGFSSEGISRTPPAPFRNEAGH